MNINNFHNVCIISYQNVSAGISSHLYTAIESAGNDKVCILHLTLYTYSILYLCIMQTVPVPKIVVTFHEEDEVHSLLIIIIIHITLCIYLTPFRYQYRWKLHTWYVYSCFDPLSYSCISYQNECGHPCTAAESSGSDQVCVLVVCKNVFNNHFLQIVPVSVPFAEGCEVSV